MVTAVVAAMPMHESSAPAYKTIESAAAVSEPPIALELRATPKVVVDSYAKVVATHFAVKHSLPTLTGR